MRGVGSYLDYHGMMAACLLRGNMCTAAVSLALFKGDDVRFYRAKMSERMV
jgi:hypothetical protein